MNYKHGKRKTPIYGVWTAMLARCTNPATKCYANYGGRGITVCERWMTFANFYADMGDAPTGMTLDRADNDKGYSPENCRWATSETQQRNRRNIRQVTVGDKTQTLTEWSAETGIALTTIWARINKGWPPEVAVMHPIVRTRKNARSGIPAYAFGAEQNVRFDAPSSQG